MPKQTYWIANPNGDAKALVEGADQRDLWTKARGWVETTEPVSGELVWVHQPDVDARTALPFDVVGEGSHWHTVGFRLSAPPEPVDTTKDPALRDQPKPPADKPSTTETTAVATGDPKEK